MSFESTVGLLGCMDEANLLPGENGEKSELAMRQIYFGLAGTGVANLTSLNQEKLPNSTRSLFLENQRLLILAFKRVMKIIGGDLYASSHTGCAWAGLQDILDVTSATMKLANAAGVDYAGHIQYGQNPVQLGNSPVYASIAREEHKHRHVATSILCPVGGGITGGELYRQGGDPFIIDVDFAAEALKLGMPIETAVAIVAAQIDMADGIMDGKIGVQNMNPFNARRLSESTASINHKIFDLAVNSLQ